MKPNHRERPRNAARRQAESLLGLAPSPAARRAAARRIADADRHLQQLAQAADQQRQKARAFMHNALVAVVVQRTGLDPNLVRPNFVQVRTTPSDKVIVTATIEFEVAHEEWAAHFNTLLVPFSGPITYNAHPAPKPPPAPCRAPSPPGYGRMNCSLLTGHPGPHEHLQWRWNATVRR